MLNTNLNDLFGKFDLVQIAAIQAAHVHEKLAIGQAKAFARHSKHVMRRAKAQSTLGEILPADFAEGDSVHVISHGDIDALSYLQYGKFWGRG